MPQERVSDGLQPTRGGMLNDGLLIVESLAQQEIPSDETLEVLIVILSE